MTRLNIGFARKELISPIIRNNSIQPVFELSRYLLDWLLQKKILETKQLHIFATDQFHKTIDCGRADNEFTSCMKGKRFNDFGMTSFDAFHPLIDAITPPYNLFLRVCLLHYFINN